MWFMSVLMEQKCILDVAINLVILCHMKEAWKLRHRLLLLWGSLLDTLCSEAANQFAQYSARLDDVEAVNPSLGLLTKAPCPSKHSLQTDKTVKLMHIRGLGLELFIIYMNLEVAVPSIGFFITINCFVKLLPKVNEQEKPKSNQNGNIASSMIHILRRHANDVGDDRF